MAAGNRYMAHRCGFTARVLTGTLQAVRRIRSEATIRLFLG